jgi:hypothetical protein
VRNLEQKNRKKIVESVDIVVAIFIIITGFVVIWFIIDFSEPMTSPYQPDYFEKIIWIFLLLGITTVVYGIKRMIQNAVR